MKSALAVGVLLFVMGIGVQAKASCYEDDIQTVSDDGEIIELLDGSVWRSLDPGTSVTWLATDSVLVCDDDIMINKDEGGERVDVQRE